MVKVKEPRVTVEDVTTPVSLCHDIDNSKPRLCLLSRILQHQSLCVAKLKPDEEDDDLVQVPLVMAPFWVQVNDLPPSFFSNSVAKQFGDFIGSFLKDLNCGRGCVFGRIAFIAVADITDAIAVIAGVGVPWDLSLRTLLKRAATTTSVWLQEETNINLILGFNLEANLYDPGKKMIELFGGTGKDDMERDLEERGKLISNNEHIILECLWIGKSTGCAEALAYAKGLNLGWNGKICVILRSFSSNYFNVEIQEENRDLKFITNAREQPEFIMDAWWIMEESCEPEVRRLWEITSGNIPTRLVELCVGLLIWVKQLRKQWDYQGIFYNAWIP
ncbi:hypothetical protein Goshw_010507 [Gossypium schwendimanii]|uniref:DUF4283 domain-containing protein n=1 Tax=Gossypium schwendimanii TaxID=34291 RepID=A0A7J9N1T5_GOSSC|nr:hypothetical protein [Gossypium schwendimanii]